MPEGVLDSSAILAVILGQPGREEIRRWLPGACVSAVCLAEVVGKLCDLGIPEPEARGILGRFELLVIPFDPADAWPTGMLRRRTRSQGLSLADRACLALALARGVPAVTMDRAWGRLGLGNAVRVVPRR